eukprot:COSAG02_NODE_27421_length_610_cov_0.845401_1_plen_100_part_10
MCVCVCVLGASWARMPKKNRKKKGDFDDYDDLLAGACAVHYARKRRCGAPRADRQTDRQTSSPPASQTGRQPDSQTGRQTERQPASQPASQPDRQTDRQT